MPRTPEAKTTENSRFTDVIKSFRTQIETHRKDQNQLEVGGYKLIEHLIAELFKDVDSNDIDFTIRNEALRIATSRIIGISEMLLVDNWTSNRLHGLLKVSKPTAVYGIASQINLDFKLGTMEQFDGVNILLNYDDGYVTDLDSLKRHKSGEPRVEVKFYYQPGLIFQPLIDTSSSFTYENKSGKKLVESLNQSDTLTKLEFVAEFLAEAFSKNPEKLQ